MLYLCTALKGVGKPSNVYLCLFIIFETITRITDKQRLMIRQHTRWYVSLPL